MGNDDHRFPRRKHLPRIPVWLPQDQPVVYFATACCAQRRKVFAQSAAVRIGVECLRRVEARQRWKVANACFMPDHVHLLLSPSESRDQSLSEFMRAWKSCVVLRLRRTGVTGDVWQREFHDRLLRSDEKLDEKWEYIRLNPVRAGLCATPEDYPYSGTTEEILQRLGRITIERDGAIPRNNTGHSRPTITRGEDAMQEL